MSFKILYKGLQAAAIGSVGYVGYDGSQKILEQRQTRLDQIEEVRSQIEKEREKLDKVLSDKVIMAIVEKHATDAELLSEKKAQPLVKAIATPKPEKSIERVQAKKAERSTSGPLFDIKESGSTRYLKEELIKVASESPLQSRAVKNYTLNFLACHHQFSRLVTKIEKGIAEHKEFVEFLEDAIKKGDYPTQDMFTNLQSDLTEFKFSYLPHGAPVLTAKRDRDPSVQELRALMVSNRQYLKDTLIPKLKQMDAAVETRDTWADLLEKNCSQNERVLNDAAEMQSLLRSQLKEVKHGEEMTEQQPKQQLAKQKVIWNAKVENEILDKLSELQAQKAQQITRDVHPVVDATIERFKKQSFSLNHAQKLRQLQGVLAEELLQQSEDKEQAGLVRQACRDLGLTNDPIVSTIVSQSDQPVKPMRNLTTQFHGVKRDALLNAYAAEDSIQMYLYGLYRLWLKEHIVGTFDKGLGSCYAKSTADRELQVSLNLDVAEQSLKEGELAECISLVSDVVDDNPSNQQQLSEWLALAQTRLSREENLKLLQMYTDKLIDLHKAHKQL